MRERSLSGSRQHGVGIVCGSSRWGGGVEHRLDRTPELVAREEQSPLAGLADDAYVGACAHDLPFPAPTRVLFAQAYDISDVNFKKTHCCRAKFGIE